MTYFFKRVAQRYYGLAGHGITLYELGNESVRTGTWAQQAAEYDLVVKAVKGINSSALIGGFGSTVPDDPYCYGYLPGSVSACSDPLGNYNEFDGIWTAWGQIAGNSREIDVITFHGYPHNDNTGSCSPGTCGPEVLTNVTADCSTRSGSGGFVQCMKNLESRLGLPSSTLLMDTEGGNQQGSHNNCGSGTSCAYTAAFIARSFLLDWAYGITQKEFFSWGTYANLATNASLNETAWNSVYNWMVGSTMTSACSVAGDGVTWSCGLKEASGQRALAVWNTSGSSSFSVAAGAWTDYRDLTGGTVSIGSNALSVPTGIEPILLENTSATGAAPSPPTGLNAVVQ